MTSTLDSQPLHRLAYELLSVVPMPSDPNGILGRDILMHSLEHQNELGTWSVLMLTSYQLARARLTPVSTAFPSLAKAVLKKVPGPDCRHGCRLAALELLTQYEGRFLNTPEATAVWVALGDFALQAMRFLLLKEMSKHQAGLFAELDSN